jgi:hypothetical protein
MVSSVEARWRALAVGLLSVIVVPFLLFEAETSDRVAHLLTACTHRSSDCSSPPQDGRLFIREIKRMLQPLFLGRRNSRCFDGWKPYLG